MFPEDPLWPGSGALPLLFGILLFVVFFGFRLYLFLRNLRRRWLEIERHKDAGTIGPSGLVQGAILPWHYDRIAQVGTAAQAELSMDQRILKPSLGVKLLVLGLCGAMVYVLTQMNGELGGFEAADQGANAYVVYTICLFAALNAVVYVFSFETRYDRDMLIVTRMIVFRREYRWKNLQQIADDGAYELHLVFEPGGKAKVLKHSRGIDAFKELALAQIQRNRVANA